MALLTGQIADRRRCRTPFLNNAAINYIGIKNFPTGFADIASIEILIVSLR